MRAHLGETEVQGTGRPWSPRVQGLLRGMGRRARGGERGWDTGRVSQQATGSLVTCYSSYAGHW